MKSVGLLDNKTRLILFGVIALSLLSFLLSSCIPKSHEDDSDIPRYPTGKSPTLNPPEQWKGVPDASKEEAGADDDDDNDDDNDSSEEKTEDIFRDDFKGSSLRSEWKNNSGLSVSGGNLTTGKMKKGAAILDVPLKYESLILTASIAAIAAEEGAALTIVARADSLESKAYRGRIIHKGGAWRLELERTGHVPTIREFGGVDFAPEGGELVLQAFKNDIKLLFINVSGDTEGGVAIYEPSPLTGLYAGLELAAGESGETAVDYFLAQRKVK